MAAREPTFMRVSGDQLKTCLERINLKNHILIALSGSIDGLDSWCMGPFRMVFQFRNDKTVYLVAQIDLHLEFDPLSYVQHLHMYERVSSAVNVADWEQFMQYVQFESEMCDLVYIPSECSAACWNDYFTWLRVELNVSYVPDPHW